MCVLAAAYMYICVHAFKGTFACICSKEHAQKYLYTHIHIYTHTKKVKQHSILDLGTDP